MRRINYPDNLIQFKKEYLQSTYGDNLKNMQKFWKEIRNSNPYLRNNFPKRISKILLSNYSKLIRYYQIYVNIFSKLNDVKHNIIELFNYDKYQPQIADFFMKNSAKLDISTCYYCETAFINTYTDDSNIKNCLSKLNTLPFDKLKELLNVKCDETVRKVIAKRPYKSIFMFNDTWKSIKKVHTANKFESIFKPQPLKNHFDLDHVLDKGSCHILSLSLMNFVPCCQVCNEKLKRTLVLADPSTGSLKSYLSPSSPDYDFENNVKIRIEPTIPIAGDDSSFDPAYAIDFPEKFKLRFDLIDSSYESIIEIFKLRERYEFHKLEGLYWLTMKNKYNDSCLEFMEKVLDDPNFTKSKIKEDIFHENYDKKRHPCFLKFKKDIIN